MTNQAEFSPTEWETLCRPPGLVAFAVSAVGDSGFFGELKELRSIMKAMKPAKKDYRDNEFVAAIIVTVSDDDSDVQELDYSPAAAVNACVEANALLDRATQFEADGYRDWVLQMAGEAAGAAKEDSVRVSSDEEALLEQVSAAFGK